MSGVPICGRRLAGRRQDLRSHLYDSLHNKLLTLPDETLVYPAHGAGSLCGKQLSSDTVSTLGDQRRLELRAAADDEGGIHESGHGRSAGRAGYFTYDAILNTRERARSMRRCSRCCSRSNSKKYSSLGDAGAQILDVRDAAEYAKGTSGGQHQYRTGRPVCDVVRNAAGSHAAYRHRGGTGA